MSLPLGCFNRPWSKFDYADALAGIAAAGYELTGTMRQQQAALIETDSTEDEVAALRAQVQRAGLRPSTVLGSFPFDGSPDESVSALEALIDRIALFGADYLLHCGTANEEHFDRFYGTMRACCDYAQDREVMLTLKPHGGISTSGADLLRAVERIDHSNFGIYYDPGNIMHYKGLDPVEELEPVAAQVVAMCIKDSLGEGAGVMITPGTGKVDFRGVFDVLVDAGFEGPCLVECVGGESLEEVNEEARKTRDFLLDLTT
jgi:sugar phosphate isomerase/epimerase